MFLISCRFKRGFPSTERIERKTNKSAASSLRIKHILCLVIVELKRRPRQLSALLKTDSIANCNGGKSAA